MPNANNEEPEGITFSVYLYVVKKGKPVGPRDTMKGAHLLSPKVAYRHLEKLEDLGFLQKNEYREYVTKDKARVERVHLDWSSHVAENAGLLPSFLSILIVELVILAIHFVVGLQFHFLSVIDIDNWTRHGSVHH